MSHTIKWELVVVVVVIIVVRSSMSMYDRVVNSFFELSWCDWCPHQSTRSSSSKRINQSTIHHQQFFSSVQDAAIIHHLLLCSSIPIPQYSTAAGDTSSTHQYQYHTNHDWRSVIDGRMDQTSGLDFASLILHSG